MKNLGPSNSGYLDPNGRCFESVVFQSGTPVLDRELILSADLGSGAAQEALKRIMPSGWLSNDFLGSSSTTSAIFNPITVANTLETPKCLAHVNGWVIRVESSNTNTTANRVDLGAAPSGAGANRTDLVILEVWRCLVSAAPDATGKSASGRIWLNGNVKIAVAQDATRNLVDDIFDANVGSETTKRVQIQYRLRVVQGIDVIAHPYGMDDPAVKAKTAPTNAATPDGATYSGPNASYTNQSANGDPGLWRAGDGSPVNGLGTVDGYIYAIPLCAVFRRNSTAFNRVTNQNGAVASPGPTDRPDGLFHDVVSSLDVLDLRFGVSPTGWSPEEVLSKNLNFLLDNALRQEVVNTAPDGGGCIGTTVLRVNEIGGSSTGAGPLIGSFDSVRRRFSDRAIYETVVVKLAPPGGSWNDGEVVTIDPTAFTPYPYPAFNWASMAPADVQILDITEMHWAGSTAASIYEDAQPWVTLVTGLGALPVTSVAIKFGSISSVGLTTESLFATLTIAYPRDCGLSHTPVASYGDGSFELVTGPLSTAAPVFFGTFQTNGPSIGGGDPTRSIDATHREVRIEYSTSNWTYICGSGSSPTNVFRLPERASLVVGTFTTPPQTDLATLDDSGREVTLGIIPNANTTVTIVYVAIRPIPAAANAKMALYFRSAAPATVGRTVLGTNLTVVPKLVSEKLLSVTVGSGSQGECYPFPQAYVQTGGVFTGSALDYNGESSMAASSSISVANFNAETGMLMLPTYISMAASPESLIFNRSASDVDIEDRTYFPRVPAGYIPNAYAQDLSSAGRHKNVLPILAELPQDTSFGFKGQIVMVLLMRYASFDAINGVFFDAADPDSNTTSASVFRVKGLLLNKRVS